MPIFRSVTEAVTQNLLTFRVTLIIFSLAGGNVGKEVGKMIAAILETNTTITNIK